ncbi:MAG: aminotransferase class I/II-fold pyridoxal phosphate-dependent enzyme [Vicinamibacterales bacterium]|jgi:cystathionine beta-lyase/cystathionine gamma-synthase|nr:cystathionine gamma-synthase [Acidobacteriota bacterium]MDP7338850.1 aminotransferase class I/II-fold pyridoxal phosphate-dependent enzyme [Vicinamibacterales bacterium]MDP7472945.1 aminotransferase class I/II-fold pyridoxal phosphate-dependent enzyme [Vicinamibacterales bacterium]MDP7673081.1 aminotransferase class I/II-fold pyridoxal phosphate-dependent enzyme [Vicinamibacterales bacterium]HJO37367.1 aminotransferase class I/II-fold pyridoxal phosphate-dependent enzyme [Vicinamibacterales 
MKPATKVIHRGRARPAEAAPLTTPIYETTTFVFDSAAEVEAHAEGRSSRHLYSRYENPTVEATEAVVAELEGAEEARLFGSGMAATVTTLAGLLKAGDEVVCCAAIYGGTLKLFTDLLTKFGVCVRLVDLEAFGRPADVLRDETRLLWFESPINPTLRCLDVEAIGAACRARGVTSVIDNTFASPINQAPLACCIDLVMHSATKYLNGHSDVTGGAVAGRTDLMSTVGATRRLMGTVLDPHAAYALGRGLKTLAVRIARHNTNALAVAQFLEADRRVRRVYYPGLASHPDHAIASRQMRGFGGIVCLDLEGGLARAAAFFDRLQLFARAASLGGVESLCSLPVLTSHHGLSAEALTRAGVSAGMARLSVGLEAPEDLVADLDRALG